MALPPRSGRYPFTGSSRTMPTLSRGLNSPVVVDLSLNVRLGVQGFEFDSGVSGGESLGGPANLLAGSRSDKTLYPPRSLGWVAGSDQREGPGTATRSSSQGHPLRS